METEFLTQMFGDENDDNIDKENIAPNTQTPAKPTSKGKNNKKKSVLPKPNGETKRKKSKDSEHQKSKKTKKVYSKFNSLQ